MYETRQLKGLPGGRGLNVAYEAVDRHASTPAADRVAIRWLGRNGDGRELTFAELAERTSRFANTLRSLAVGPAERVGILLGRVPELHVAFLGALKNGSVAAPLSPELGPEPIARCLRLGWIRVLVTTPALYAERIAPFREQLPDLKSVLLVGEDGLLPPSELPPGGHDLHAMFRRVPSEFTIPVTDAEDPALLHFAIMADGRPTGTLYLHRAVEQHHLSGSFALDLIPGDVYWCTLDAATPHGSALGVISPLTHGVTVIVREEAPGPAAAHALLRREGVDVWYTTPALIAAMRRAGFGIRAEGCPPNLRFVACDGALPPGAADAHEIYGLPIHECWGQAETGGIVLANQPSGPRRPGSLGRPLPGVEAAIVRRLPDGRLELLGPSEEGELALRAGWPSMFRTYIGEGPRYRARFVDGWYLTGDKARRDADGWFWSAGHAELAAEAALPLDPDLMRLRTWIAEPSLPVRNLRREG